MSSSCRRCQATDRYEKPSRRAGWVVSASVPSASQDVRLGRLVVPVEIVRHHHLVAGRERRHAGDVGRFQVARTAPGPHPAPGTPLPGPARWPPPARSRFGASRGLLRSPSAPGKIEKMDTGAPIILDLAALSRPQSGRVSGPPDRRRVPGGRVAARVAIPSPGGRSMTDRRSESPAPSRRVPRRHRRRRRHVHDRRRRASPGARRRTRPSPSG